MLKLDIEFSLAEMAKVVSISGPLSFGSVAVDGSVRLGPWPGSSCAMNWCVLCGTHPCVPAVTTRHSCRLEHESHIPMDLPGHWQCLCSQGALKSGGCVPRYFLSWCGFRKLCHCSQKKVTLHLSVHCTSSGML